MHPRVFVALPVFNRLNETRKFIECLRKQTYQEIQIVICDDGSTDGTNEYLNSISSKLNVHVIPGTGDLWWTGGINRCIKYILNICSDSDFVLTINNDVVLDADYIEQKIHRAAELPGTIIGSVCVYQENPEIIETSGLIMNYFTCSSHNIARQGELISDYNGYVKATHLPGKGVLIPATVYRKIGLYDEDNFPHYHADTDFVLSAHEAGIPVIVDFESIVYSDVNTKNMNVASNISLSGIVSTFDRRSGVNSFTAYRNFAIKHFGWRAVQFLIVNYVKIIFGLSKRYLRSKSFFKGKGL